MQTVFGFFLEAKNTPSAIQDVLAHNGTCISESTTRRAIKSVMDEQRHRLKKLGPSGLTSIAYDNLEFDLKVGVESQANRSTFESITTSLVFKLEHGVTVDDLKRPLVSPQSENHHGLHITNRHVTPLPKPIDVLLTSAARRRVHEGMTWVIRKILVDNWAPQHKKRLGDILSDICIPRTKTSHQPAFAVHEKCSGNDGNIKVLENLREQLGLDEEILRHHVLLVHGDLGVLERIQSVLESHHIEGTDIETLQYIETIPGLFHILMACADAVWHIYLQPKDLHDDPCGIWKQFCQLYPNMQAKLASYPGFRVMHDGIEHVIAARVLDCT